MVDRIVETHLQQELDSLRLKMLEMLAYADKALDRATTSLFERNVDLAQQVVDSDYSINQLECDIDSESLRILALTQPVARDLRTIVGYMRMVVNIERVGDEAVNIAEHGLLLSLRPPLPFNRLLEELAAHCHEMYKTAIQAFKDADPELAQRVCDMDPKADNLDMHTVKKLVEQMSQEPETVERSVHTLLVTRSFERIGDLATNIAETVIFIVKGVDIKHHCGRS